MSTNSPMSLKTKKILVSIGVAFGTVMVFLISFILAFCLIVNPVNLFTVGDEETAKENEELKKQVQTLNDEVELLNTTVDKYKSAASLEPIIITEEKPQQQGNRSDKSNSAQTTKEDSGEASSESSEDEFSPETVTGTEETTPEDVEVPITVIDISE